MKKAFADEAEARRSFLAMYVFDTLQPLWNKANIPLNYRIVPELHSFLARSYLLGVTSQNTIELACGDWGKSYEEFSCKCDAEQYGSVVYFYDAGNYLMLRCMGRDDSYYNHFDLFSDALSDDVTQRPTEFNFGGTDVWDVHFLGSVLVSGVLWQPDYNNPSLRRQYWVNWIENILPLFTGDINTARL